MISFGTLLSPLRVATLAQDGLVPLPSGAPPAAKAPSAVAERVAELKHEIDELSRLVGTPDTGISKLDLFHGYLGVFIVAFAVSLLATPVMRRLAVKFGVIDRPSEARKVHRIPIAYMGGVSVYLGLLAAILFSYTAPLHGLVTFHPSQYSEDGFLPGGVPISIVLGMTVIMIVGLLDDVLKISPRVKVGGQLFAAAALAIEDVGVKVAGAVVPIAKALGSPTIVVNKIETLGIVIHLGGHDIPIDFVYWVGTAIIAIFVIGACNASNLIDGLDGLLSGTTAIASVGLLIVALTLAAVDDGPRDASRIILCLALLGACLGFLPHNFNPATIFLGDAGSLLLGFCTIVIVLTLGDTGKTHLVLAGLIIYAVPIIDTTLAIIRRKVSGKKISDADDQHLHHMLKRALGVKGAVLVLYGIAAGFGVLGVALSEGRGRVTYALALVFAAFIGVTSFKIARREHIEKEARRLEETKDKPASKEESKPRPDPSEPSKSSEAGADGKPADHSKEFNGVSNPSKHSGEHAKK
jgi:UDP-GlcNAc:undecaprenyl-phosphate/decaprenyl-phosphate GlcNAc-1-phosphate transferase